MTTRVAIDLNVRVRGNGTYAGLEDVSGPLAVGQSVVVHEPESGLEGAGRVTEIDPRRELVYLSVDWASLRETPNRDAPERETGQPAALVQSCTWAGPRRQVSHLYPTRGRAALTAARFAISDGSRASAQESELAVAYG